jgi:outer membrane protein
LQPRRRWAWQALITARAQITAFNAQVGASQIALDGVNQEAVVGLRTTLDVLDAEQELFVARVNLVRAQRDEIVSAYWLKQSIGELSAATLGLPVALYDATEHYDAVRDKWFGLGSGG